LLPTPEGGHVYDLHHRGAHAIRCWLCVDAAMGDEMWSAAVAAKHPWVVSAPGRTPWLAVALMPAAIALGLSDPRALMAAGDLERCVAWALLE
jgi:hypothetical protein